MPLSVLLDLSRLLSSAGRPPSGIDRVELAYARHFLGVPESSACAIGPFRRFGPIDRTEASDFIAALQAHWRSGGPAAGLGRRVKQIRRRLLRGEAALTRQARSAGGTPTYMLVSHHHLDPSTAIERMLQRTGARFICLVHDLIPVTFGEYARPGQAEAHARRMRTVARLADGLILNSTATAREFAPFLAEAGREPTVCVAPLGVDLPTASTSADGETPAFICIGTIEPRKNHLLLLNLWRALAATLGAATPHLLLVGRRGWENENIIDMIERCQPIRGFVHEHNDLADAELARLLGGARALLLPSFAEGYGLPVAEALAAGVPVLCSDLPALREVGGDVPEYLDPLDGAAWRAAIVDYAAADSPRRSAQLARLRNWRPPRWSKHFDAIERLIENRGPSVQSDAGTNQDGENRAGA
jgi:glycosyltransferase involved in cell wall biosynthesis